MKKINPTNATIAYHPTKGYRRVAYKRSYAQAIMSMIFMRARSRRMGLDHG